MEYGLTDHDIKNIKQVLSQHTKLNSAILYGSRAKGNFKTGSDIDLTLIGEGLSYKDLMDISIELDDLLLPYEFDLSLYHDIENDALRSHIQRVGKALYQNES